ncbi:hypothetical protein MKW92_014952 [Papaver armeniacum]|nr:hypothetical protein MKW92_014952 [Papaver armeniacum]
MGTRRSHGNISLLLLLMFSILVPNASSKWLNWVTVHVQNDIEGNEVALDMHCRSNDDDLGQRTLHQGEEWHWKFRIAYFSTTHFWCDFRWYDNQDQRWYSGTFDVYRASLGKHKYKDFCASNCPWSARRDGFYLYRRDDQKWEKRNEWHAE